MPNYRRKTAQFEWGTSRVMFRYRPGDSLAAATFARTSVATYADVNGVLQQAASGVARDAHYVNGVRTLLLERESTNLCVRSDEFNDAAWTKSAAGAGTAPVVTANAATAPDGTTTADEVVFAAPGAGDLSQVAQGGITTTAASLYAGSLWVRAASGADVGKVLLLRQVGAASYLSITLTAAWQRVQRAETAAGTTSEYSVALRPDFGSSTGTVTAYLWRAQLELGDVATSEIKTEGTTATRARDSLSFPFTPAMRDLTVRVRGVELGTALFTDATHHYVSIGNAAPWLIGLRNGTRQFGAYYENGSVVTSTPAAQIALGDTVELRIVLLGSGAVQGGLALNDGAEGVGSVTAAPSGGLATTVPDGKIHFGSATASQQGAFAFAELAVVTSEHSRARMIPVGAGGGIFERILQLGYPLDEAIAYDRPAEGSRKAFLPSGVSDAWDAGTAYLLDGVVRWIPRDDVVSPAATGWDGVAGFRAFLEHARRGNQVWFCPDVTDLSTGWSVFLEAPYDEPPSLEPDMTRAVRVSLRGTVPFDGY